MMRGNAGSLQTRLLVAVALLLLVLLVGALWTVRHYVGQEVRRVAKAKLQQSAALFRSTLDQYQERLLNRARLLAQLPSLHDGFTDHPDHLLPLLDEVRRTGAAQVLWAADPSGRVLTSTDDRIASGSDWHTHPLVERLLAGQEASGIFLIGDLWMMAAGAPVISKPDVPLMGAVVLGIILAEPWMARLNEVTDAEVRFAWQEEWLATTTWPKGLAERSLAPGAAQEVPAPRGPMMLLDTALPGAFQLQPPVSVRILRPIEMQLVYQIQTAVSTVGALVLALGLAVALVMSRSITRPVRLLVADTQRIGAGDLSHRSRIRGHDEIAQLGRAFNEMVEQLEGSHRELQQLNETLEEKVRERTKALEAAQQQLIQQEKLASIGQLAAGVAHELNNPLMAIMGNAQLSMRLLKQGESSPDLIKELQELLEVLSREAFRSKTIVANLLDFARMKPTTRTPVDIHRLVEDSLKLVGHQASLSNVRIERAYATGLSEVPIDPQQITQVFVNILVNAVQAMAGGGTLTVATQQADGWVRVAFKDTGLGIAPEHLAKVFDPFFTTKEPGQGTGLGLSVSYGIIQRHQGKIELTSRVGQGTTVTVVLPLTPAA